MQIREILFVFRKNRIDKIKENKNLKYKIKKEKKKR